MTDFLGAAPGERTATRAGYRAGYYERGLITQVGKIKCGAARSLDLLFYFRPAAGLLNNGF